MPARWLVPAVVFALCLATYLATLTPGVDFVDSGELAAACATLGIAHPTGYPLFTLLGYLFAHLPVGPTPIVRLNRMSALFAALGAAVFCVCFKAWFDTWRPLGGRAGATPPTLEESDSDRSLAAGFGALVLGWSFVYWGASTTLEVYSLQGLLVALMLTLCLAWVREADAVRRRRQGWLCGLAVGLGCANHLTTLLVLPALIGAVLSGQRRWVWRRRETLPFVAGALLGLSLYAYLPVRWAMQPAVSWGDLGSLHGFVEHVTGAAFRGRMLRWGGEGEGMRDFFARVPARLGYVAVGPLLVGVWSLGRAGSRRRLGAVALLFVPALVFAATYDIPDNLSYFVPCYVALAACCGAGLLLLLRAAHGRRWWRAAVLAVALLAVGAELRLNWPWVDRSANHLVEDFAMTVLDGLAPGAILFVRDVDILAHPLLYYQVVAGVRPDVTVIVEHLLRKPWAYAHLARRDAALYARSAREIAALERALGDRERWDRRRIDALETDVIASIIRENAATRPIYMTSEFDPEGQAQFHPGWRRIPEGLVFRLYRDGETVAPYPFHQVRFRPLPYPDKDADAVRHAYLFMFNERGRFEAARGDCGTALRWIDYALSFFPPRALLSNSENGRRVLPNRLRAVRATREQVAARCSTSPRPPP